MRALLLVFVLTLSASPAAAAGDEATTEAKALFGQATLDYKAGRFQEALVGFEAAYAKKPLPEILYNIAQCHMNLENYERAAFFYDAFLQERPEADIADEVRQQIALAELKLSEQRAAERERLEKQRLEEERRLEAERAVAAEAERQRLEEARRLEEQRLVAEREEAERLDAEERERAMWTWGMVGGGSLATVLAATAVTGIVVALLPPEVVPPSGSLGAIDRRGGAQ